LKQKDLIAKTRRHIVWFIVSTTSLEHYMMTPL